MPEPGKQDDGVKQGAPVVDIINQYDLGDTEPEPVTLPSSKATPPDQPATPATPRDPESGRYVKPLPHPERLLRLARDLDLSEEEIRASTTAELRETIRDAQMERDILRRQESINTAVETSKEQARQQEPIAPVAPPSEVDGLDEKGFDESLVKILKAQAAEIQSLKARVENSERFVGDVQRQTVAQKFDREFAGLGETYESLIGKGRGNTMKADSAELARRKIIIAEAARLAGPKANVDQIAAKVKDAIGIIYPGEYAAKKPAEPAKPAAPIPDEDDWAAAGLARPTHRTGAEEPPGRSKAVKTVAKFLRENGVAGGDTTLDEFPK